jgi:hypothetical protein
LRCAARAIELHQVICTSHANGTLRSAERIALLAQSRRKYAAAGITGLLLHADGSFMQTIEGWRGSIAILANRARQGFALTSGLIG